MFGLLILIVHLLLALNALVRSVLERFVLGSVGGLLRVVLVAVSAVYGFKSSFAGSDGPAAGPALVLLVAGGLGPIVSFLVLFMAYRRMREVPAAQEERASRVFKAWLGVGIIDAMSVVIAVAAHTISGP
ncbi:MAG: hypothetical protein KF819_31400 [Labilithrix sp.]|nr:hypothetical protein [Labilithrix sp.]